jgi:hypothetical protein
VVSVIQLSTESVSLQEALRKRTKDADVMHSSAHVTRRHHQHTALDESLHLWCMHNMQHRANRCQRALPVHYYYITGTGTLLVMHNTDKDVRRITLQCRPAGRTLHVVCCRTSISYAAGLQLHNVQC